MKHKGPHTHLRDGGCSWSRHCADKGFTTRHGEVTCPSCLKTITRRGLRDRAEYPPIPTFLVKIVHGRTLGFRCPCCGGMNLHGGGDYPGDGNGHRGSHCPCWRPLGYYIHEVPTAEVVIIPARFPNVCPLSLLGTPGRVYRLGPASTTPQENVSAF